MISEWIKDYIEKQQTANKRKRLNINELETKLAISLPEYQKKGEYLAFYHAIKQLEKEATLAPILNKQDNGRYPYLPLNYWILPQKQKKKWDKLEMLKLADRLDLSYYHANPQWQTEAEWKRVVTIYNFLENKELAVPISIEERSLQLFDHEKFLIDNKLFPVGKGLLARLKITYEDLKAKRIGEPFVFWLKPGIWIHDIERILIVENLSFFHTARQLVNQPNFSFPYEVIIYGSGKKIESSLQFFNEFFPPKDYEMRYVGDLDPEGYSILVRLMQRYPLLNLQPEVQIYRDMLSFWDKQNDIGDQVENETHRDIFLDALGDETCKQSLLILWTTKKRIPQEVLNLQNWKGFS